MRVVIDARMVGAIPHGVARFVTQLAKGLLQLSRESLLDYEVVFLIDPGLPNSSPLREFGSLRTVSKYLSPRELFEIPRRLRELGADLYHSPSFSSLILSGPHVLTLHDLNHLHFGNGPQKLYYQSLLRSFAKSAKAITSVSEFSAKEIADWLKIPQAKIQLTPNAIDPADLELSDFEQVQAESYLDQLQLKKGRFFIALSNPKPHKNLELLVRAYGQYRDSSAQPWPLVLSVPPGRSGIQGPGIFCLGSLTDTQAKIVLQSSGGVVFPSLYEGFGIPPLEAAVLGIPLAVSDIPSHREGLVDLSSEEVLWCSPLSEEPWRRAFHQLAEGVIPGANSETRNLVLKRWSVQNLALNMDRVYREALGLPPRNLRDLDKPTHPSLRAENLSLGT